MEMNVRLMFLWFIHTVSITAFTHFIKLKIAVIVSKGVYRKTSMDTRTVKLDLSNSMAVIVLLPKKSIIQICCV